MKRLLSLFVFMVAAAGILLPGCAQKPEQVRIAVCPYTGDLPFFLATEKGLYKKYGVEVTETKCANSSEALNALLADKVDVIGPISFSALLAAEIQAPGELKLFLTGGETDKIVGSDLLVKKDSPISDLMQLKGKKIGTYSGATQLLYLKLFLKQAGLDPDKDVKIVQVGTELQVPALEAGQFDALFTIEPYITIALQKGTAKVLVENPRVKYIASPFISGAAATTAKFVKERPAALKRLYKAIAAGVDLVRQNESEARAVLTKYTPLDSSLAQKASLVEFYKVDESVDWNAVQKISDLLYENKVQSAPVKVKDMFLTKEQLQ
jgi:NitT/TauT family transport system substrate-binding protein